jgi:xylose isomerase
MEDHGWTGTRAFDVKPYRSDTAQEVWDLVRGCIRSYLILRDKVRQWNEDREIQELVSGLDANDPELEALSRPSPENAQALREQSFDPTELAARSLGYQRLDQLTFELLTGVRG